MPDKRANYRGQDFDCCEDCWHSTLFSVGDRIKCMISHDDQLQYEEVLHDSVCDEFTEWSKKYGNLNNRERLERAIDGNVNS